MVVISFPAVSRMRVTQDRVACPLRWTVHAPQRPTPQPNFDPVSPKTSRRYQSSGISSSPLNDCSAPFTFNWIIFASTQYIGRDKLHTIPRSTFRSHACARSLRTPNELAFPFAGSLLRNLVLAPAPIVLHSPQMPRQSQAFVPRQPPQDK